MKKILLGLHLVLLAPMALAINAGKPLPDQDYPFMVRVYTYPENAADKLTSTIDWCSGVVVANNAVLTAGHCTPNKDQPAGVLVSVLQYDADGVLHRYDSKKFVTTFVRVPTPDGYPQDSSSPGYVKGCYVPGRLTKTVEPDAALVLFPKGTFKSWVEIDMKPVLPGEKVTMYGFGYRNNSLASPVMGPTLEPKGLSASESVVWDRQNEQRFAVLNRDGDNFADAGDSGGAVLYNNRLVGIINTREQKCETPFGEDYAISNTLTRMRAIQYLFKYLDQPTIKNGSKLKWWQRLK